MTRLTHIRRKTSSEKRASRSDLAVGRMLYPEALEALPATRAGCPETRPCPHVRCRYNNYLDVTENGSLVQPLHEPWDAVPSSSCSLDVADRGEHTLEEVGAIFGVTRERMRQIEVEALDKARRWCLRHGLKLEELLAAGPEGRTEPGVASDASELPAAELPEAGRPFGVRKKDER